MPLPDNSQNYENFSQGIDRITDILQRRSAPVQSSPLQSEASQLPLNLLQAINYSGRNYETRMSNSNFAQDVQNFEMNRQNQQMAQQESLLKAYEMKLKMGDAQAKALDNRIRMFVGDDPQATAIILEELNNDPEAIDPNNAFQTSSKIAGIVKRYGLQNVERELDLQGKAADISFKNAQSRRMSADAASDRINYGPSGGASTAPVPAQNTNMTPSQQSNAIIDLYGSSEQQATQPSAQPSPQQAAQPPMEAKPIPLYKGDKPYTDGLERGFQWAQMPDGTLASMKIPSATKENSPEDRILKTTTGLLQDYSELNRIGAAVSQDQPFLQNKINQVLLSEDVVGEFGGQTIMKGTPQQAIVDRIKSSIPALLLDLKEASGAGAKQFDSNVDVRFMRQQASNPTNDFASNLITLNRISKNFTGRNLPGFFDNEAQAEAASLPPGTMIFINGRRAVVE